MEHTRQNVHKNRSVAGDVPMTSSFLFIVCVITFTKICKSF